MHARHVLGLPDSWRWLKLDSEDDGRGGVYFIIEGAISTGVVFKSGPRKGEINWKHKTGERRLIISRKEHDDFIASWEAKTGSCAGCGGTGAEFASWSALDGEKTRPCRKCKATGKAAK